MMRICCCKTASANEMALFRLFSDIKRLVREFSEDIELKGLSGQCCLHCSAIKLC
jgi:hypothetical protein